MNTTREPHSAEYFGTERDFWWNSDFLALMGKRWQLDKVKTLLDVGCGLGHWGQLLSKLLPKDAKITGIDREEAWVEGARERVKEYGERFSYSLGSAEKIPFPDASFDMVTCQTVLLHVKDAKAAIKEMLRVLKPGGLIAVVEPNNIANELLFDSCSRIRNVEETVKLVRFHLLCERGAEARGIGCGSVGDHISGYFHDFGLHDIKIFLSDKASAMHPPYSSQEHQAYIKQMQEWFDAELFVWTKDETKNYYKAGGGDLEDFESNWQLLRNRFKKQLEDIAQNRYVAAGGHVFYLVSARK